MRERVRRTSVTEEKSLVLTHVLLHLPSREQWLTPLRSTSLCSQMLSSF